MSQLSLKEKDLGPIIERLAESNQQFAAHYPGDPIERQPVHSVYGGAQLFKAETPQKLGQLAVRSLQASAPNFVVFAQALGLAGAEELPENGAQISALAETLAASPPALDDPVWQAYTIYQRVRDKLSREPVEDLRVDFEDGYGYRSDEEEDGHCLAVADQLAIGLERGTLPPFIGFRPKSFSPECYARAVRTLDLVLTRLAEKSGGQLPDNFMVTLPKVTHPGQVEAMVALLDALEAQTGLPTGGIRLDLMIETPQVIINPQGEAGIKALVEAGQGRVKSVAYGTYDYTAACNITAAYQSHTHAAADFSRHVMQVSLAGTGVTFSDGATNLMPIGPYKAKADQPLTTEQLAENQATVHHAWRVHFNNVRHSLAHGYYQGWDLHPGQLPVRYAAMYAFFLEGLPDASRRLNNFITRAAQASRVGNVFDDAATGQGLLNFFLRGLACGALTEAEVLATGITVEELHSRSFAHIVANRAVG
ncbi:MAG: phosphoenolpyruvate kinase [Anaerolineae bacterium]|nr:phosphoenolpyruvate kinase [Anaerolineae bacterium]